MGERAIAAEREAKSELQSERERERKKRYMQKGKESKRIREYRDSLQLHNPQIELL